jgi:hypothetical protein
MFIDSSLDHINRGVDIRHVYEMAEKARRNDDGSLVSNPTFTGRYSDANNYNHCICGHYIEHNYIAKCVETGKCFVVGCDCIVTVCETNRWKYSKMCQICETNDALKTKNVCKECSSSLKNFTKTMKVGKYSGQSFYEIYELDKKYVEWVRLSDSTQKAVVQFSEWIDSIETHPELVTHYANEFAGECLRIAGKKHLLENERVRNKERVYVKVRYDDKEYAKSLGIRWDPGCKSWYIQRLNLNPKIIERFPLHDEETQKRLRLVSESKILHTNT